MTYYIYILYVRIYERGLLSSCVYVCIVCDAKTEWIQYRIFPMWTENECVKTVQSISNKSHPFNYTPKPIPDNRVGSDSTFTLLFWLYSAKTTENAYITRNVKEVTVSFADIDTLTKTYQTTNICFDVL